MRGSITAAVLGGGIFGGGLGGAVQAALEQQAWGLTIAGVIGGLGLGVMLASPWWNEGRPTEQIATNPDRTAV